LIFLFAGAGHGQLERIRAYVSALCRGWPADQVREIVAANLERLVVPYLYPEALALLESHKTAGRDRAVRRGSAPPAGRPGPARHAAPAGA